MGTAHSDLLVRGQPGDVHGGGPDDPRLEPGLDLQGEGGGARPGATRGSVHTQATMASVTRQGPAVPGREIPQEALQAATNSTTTLPCPPLPQPYLPPRLMPGALTLTGCCGDTQTRLRSSTPEPLRTGVQALWRNSCSQHRSPQTRCCTPQQEQRGTTRSKHKLRTPKHSCELDAGHPT